MKKYFALPQKAVEIGSTVSVFMFCGFIKSIPLEIEEAAMIDSCAPLQTFFRIVLPILKPTMIPIAVQYLRGGYGSVDMGAMMAMLVLAILPIIIFYLLSQKHIIKGVAAGAVKG